MQTFVNRFEIGSMNAPVFFKRIFKQRYLVMIDPCGLCSSLIEKQIAFIGTQGSQTYWAWQSPLNIKYIFEVFVIPSSSQSTGFDPLLTSVIVSE